MVATAGRNRILRTATLLALAGMSACAPQTDYQAPRFPFAARYAGAEARPPVLLSNARWWTRMNDPVLNRLVARALSDNLSLAQARARTEAARAAAAAVPGAASLQPSATLRAEGSDPGTTEGVGTAQAGLSWLLDPQGARAAERRAAGARAEIAEAERDAAQLLLLSDLATAYVDLRYRQQLLALREAELRGRRRTLAQTRTMAEVSAVTRVEVTRSQARLAEIEAQLPAARAAIAAQETRIAVLLGTTPGSVGFGTAPPPRAGLAPDLGVPADLIRNRPDIRIAERRYYAAIAGIDQARAALYPSLSLSGLISLNALEGGTSATEFYFGPALSFPALPAGPARATVRARHAEAQAAHIAWTATVLEAIGQVETALLEYRSATASLQSAARAARLYGETLTLTREVFDRGEAVLGDLIDAEEALTRAQDAQAATIRAQNRAFITLNVQLGSGNSVSPEQRL